MIEKMLMIYPDVELSYATWYHGNRCFDTLPDIKQGKYGYILREGQQLCAVRYHETNHNCHFGVTVLEIQEDGMLVRDYKTEIFLPWICELPNGGKVAPRKMYIEPCDDLYEANSMQDIVSGNIRLEECKYINGKKIPDRSGYGMWFQHGGWRQKVSRYAENLNNFIKLGQLSIEDIKEERNEENL